jgi:hypothetical protein
MNDDASEDELQDEYEAEPRSILSALWFRAVLTVTALGIVGAIAMPYVIEWARSSGPPAKPASAASARVTPPSAAVPSPAPSPAQPVVAHVPPTAPPSSATPAAGPAPAASASGLSAIVPETRGHLSIPPPATAAPVPAVSAPVASAQPSLATPPSPASVGDRGAPAEKPSATDSKPAMVASAVAKFPTSEGVQPTPTKAVMGLTSAGPYWIQVGAYKDPDIAQRVATRLRGQGYHVEELAPPTDDTAAPAAPTRAAPASAVTTTSDKYEVWVTGASLSTVGERLRAKGLTAAPVASGVIVKPPLPLADAIALSKDFALDGLKVQVRREGGPPAAAPPSPAPSGAASADGLHRVRVGAFSDRGAAVAALRELSEKGYQGFIARSLP